MPNLNDPATLVAAGYDAIADAYRAWSHNPAPRLAHLAQLTDRLPPNGTALELGCGDGLPVSQQLAAMGHRVTGIDISSEQIMRARRNVPAATFRVADMATVELPDGSYDAAVAFYSITHVPRTLHADLLERMARWLKPGGHFLASLGARDCPDWTGDWLGAPMFFSHYDAATNRALVESAGFAVLADQIIGEVENGRMVEFLWILARKV